MGTNNYNAIRPAVENYRDPRVPDEVAFTFDAGITDMGDTFKVEFSSTLDPLTAREVPHKVEHLLGLDHAALLDAETQPGFRHYFADSVSELGMARSFCLWDTPEEARVASQRPAHQAAVQYAVGEGRDVYGYYAVSKSKLTRVETGLYISHMAFMAIKHGEIVTAWTRQS